jgi:hypothetical protein
MRLHRQNEMKMPGDWLFKVVPVFIAVVWIAVFGGIAALIYFGVKAVKGLEGCTPALVTSEQNGQKSTSIECKE